MLGALAGIMFGCCAGTMLGWAGIMLGGPGNPFLLIWSQERLDDWLIRTSICRSSRMAPKPTLKQCVKQVNGIIRVMPYVLFITEISTHCFERSFGRT